MFLKMNDGSYWRKSHVYGIMVVGMKINVMTQIGPQVWKVAEKDGDQEKILGELLKEMDE